MTYKRKAGRTGIIQIWRRDQEFKVDHLEIHEAITRRMEVTSVTTGDSVRISSLELQ